MSSSPSHPLLTPHDDTMIAWQQACTHAAETLRPQHDRERLAKALALAHEGAVTLDDDGAALVTSHGTRYRIDADGLCHCPDMQNRGVACKHVLAVQIHRQATAALASGTPNATPLATAQAERQPSADRWAVTEAPSSCCVRLHIGELELMHTMRDVSDAELTSRVQHLVPWGRTCRPSPRAARPARHAPPAARRGRSRPGGRAISTPSYPAAIPRPTCRPSSSRPCSRRWPLSRPRAATSRLPPARPLTPPCLPVKTAGARATRSPWSVATMRKDVVESLARGRGTLVSRQVAPQGTGWRPGALAWRGHPQLEAATRRERTLAAGGAALGSAPRDMQRWRARTRIPSDATEASREESG